MKIKYNFNHPEGEYNIDRSELPENWELLSEGKKEAILEELIELYRDCVYDRAELSIWVEQNAH